MASDTTSETAAADPAAGPAADAIGDLFGLTGAEAELMQELCAETLGARGIDADRLFDGLRSGQTVGRALGLPAEFAEVLYGRAHRWAGIGRFDRAEPLFRALCVTDGDVADHWVGLGICLHQRGAEDQAELALRTARSVRPDWALPGLHLAEIAIGRGDLDAVRRGLAEFRQKAGEDIPAPLFAQADRLEKAVAMRAAPPA